MATRGIEIPLSINPAKLIRGMKITEREFEDLQDTIEDVAKEGDDLERGLEDNFRDTARAADKLKRNIDQVEDEIGDVEAEAADSAKGFASAFRGDPVEALEEVQSYLAEIVTVKLPGFAGAVATIAGGAVLGLVVAGVEKWRERQEEINAKADEYVRIIDGANTSLTKTNELLVAQAVLEEASAAQLADIALLAAARGETVEQYVTNVLSGEVSTSEELARIQGERNALADELLTITRDGNAANDDQIPLLQQQDQLLQAQAEALREQGTLLGDNKTALDRAKDAALLLEASYARAKREATLLNTELNNATRPRTVNVTISQRTRNVPQP